MRFPFKRGTIIAVLALVLSVLIGLLASSAASASPGLQAAPTQLGNGTASGTEYVRMFIVLYGREPSADEYDRDIGFIHDDCRWGLTENAYNRSTDQVVHNRLRGNIAGHVDALFRAFLNRGATATDVATYRTTMYGSSNESARGIPWTVLSILSSPEYHERLDQLCQGVNPNLVRGGMYDWQTALDIADELTEEAGLYDMRCTFMDVFRDLNPIERQFTRGKAFAKQVGKITDDVYNDLDGACQASADLLLTAGRIAEVATDGEGYNPVFIVINQKTTWAETFDEGHYVVGPDPTDWTERRTRVGGAPGPEVGDFDN